MPFACARRKATRMSPGLLLRGRYLGRLVRRAGSTRPLQAGRLLAERTRLPERWLWGLRPVAWVQPSEQPWLPESQSAARTRGSLLWSGEIPRRLRAVRNRWGRCSGISQSATRRCPAPLARTGPSNSLPTQGTRTIEARVTHCWLGRSEGSTRSYLRASPLCFRPSAFQGPGCSRVRSSPRLLLGPWLPTETRCPRRAPPDRHTPEAKQWLRELQQDGGLMYSRCTSTIGWLAGSDRLYSTRNVISKQFSPENRRNFLS